MTKCTTCKGEGAILCPTCKGIGQWVTLKNSTLWRLCLLLTQAYTAVEIAESINSTEPTVKYHISNLCELTNSESRYELTNYLIKYWDCELFQLGLTALEGKQ